MAPRVKPVSSKGGAVTLPLHYRARSYQQPVWEAFTRGVKRHVAVWHRRAGKDITYLNATVCAMRKCVGNYRHIFPTLKQGRDILWDGIDARLGMRYLDTVFPPALVLERNESELSVVMRHPTKPDEPGSQWQIVGTDRNLNALVGGNPIGMVFSEYALQHPLAWVLAQPILRENGGWAAFAYTPRGQNHGYDLYKLAMEHPDWFCSRFTIEQTQRDAPGEPGGPVITAAEVQADIEAGLIEEAIAQQEYWVSFDAPLQGAYYAQQFARAEQERRLGEFAWHPQYPVHTAWDLGVDDSTAIWFIQAIEDELRVLDYYELWGQSLEHYVKVLRDKPYVYGDHYAPHDIENRDWSARLPGSSEARTRREMAASLGIRFTVVPRHNVADGIQAVRTLFPRMRFNQALCAPGIKALKDYQRLYDDKRKIFLNEPYHNWASHGADAMRTFAMGFRETMHRLGSERQRFATGLGTRQPQQTFALGMGGLR